MEEWKTITDFPDYEVSNQGRVRRIWKSGKKLRKFGISVGYYRLDLYNDAKPSMKLIHRLVAEAFIPNPENKPEVDHINRNRLDNRIENLRWSTSFENHENMDQPTNTGEKYITIGEYPRCLKTVSLSIPVNGKRIHKLFYTLEDAIEYRDQILSTA